MLPFFNVNNAKNTISPKTAGYDIHFAIAEGEDQLARIVKDKVISYIEEHKKNNPEAPIHITKHQQTDKPVGPWKTTMWEIQLFTVAPDASPFDSSAIDDNKIKKLHAFVLNVAEFTKNTIEESKLRGTLFIHENIWPKDSDMKGERKAHFDTAWIACGPKPVLKDVWEILIDMESFIRQLIQKAGDNWRDNKEAISLQFKEQFKANNSYQESELQRVSDFLINGYDNLKKMEEQDNLTKSTSPI